MSWRIAFLMLALTSLASAQIAVNNHATGLALPNPFILPDAPVNDTEQFQIDIVNTGSDTVTIESATVFGEYYTLCCESAFNLAPGGVQTLTLEFSPQNTGYISGSLQINAQAILLFAQGLPADSLFLQTAAGIVQAHAGTPLTFADGTAGPITCLLENNWSGPVTVNSISVTGNWVISNVPATPLLLQAGQQAAFTLTPSGSASDGSISGVVSIDQWSYAIVAQPVEPTLQIQVASPLMSGVQSPIAIHFNPAPVSAITGSVQLSFTADTTIALTDPAILFPSSGSATIAFTSAPGQADATFSGAASATLQTGTTVGTIHIVATWGNASVSSDVHITPEPIAIDTVSAKRESNALVVTVTGYDNTRTAGMLSFSFFNSSGGFIGNPVSADFTEAFYTYFFQQAYNAGGMFQMTANFPVTGNPADVASVQVDLMNTAGDAQSSITPF